MKKISEEFPRANIREGGFAALLTYLDFFSTAVQRTALQAASNCCQKVSSEHSPMICGVWPNIYHPYLFGLFGPAAGRICLPLRYSCGRFVSWGLDREPWVIGRCWFDQSSKPTASTSWRFTFDSFKHVHITSPSFGNVRTSKSQNHCCPSWGRYCQILIGVLPSTSDSDADQGLGGGLADMTVMESLASSKDHIEEAAQSYFGVATFAQRFVPLYRNPL